ncbi:MAG TPA: helix-turn-helix transcriptional regulator [Acidimicrobiales bacterium]
MRRQKLAEARKKAGKSQEQVAHELGLDRTTIGKWERGESTPHPQQRPRYADALGISLHELDQMLSGLPPADGRTPIWLAQYLGMEQSASSMRSHETQVVDGLLQTPDYAAAIARSVGVGETPESYVQRNIEQRAWRQARVLSGDLQLFVVQPETVLRLQLGTPEVMAGQMDRLVELGDRPNVTYQIVPFSIGQYEAMRMGAFKIFIHPWTQGASVYVIRHEGTFLVDDADEAENYEAAWEQATRLALSPDETAALCKEAAEQWRSRR